MKAREMKKLMLLSYAVEIDAYENALSDVRAREKSIRLRENDLKMYFGVEKKHKFD